MKVDCKNIEFAEAIRTLNCSIGLSGSARFPDCATFCGVATNLLFLHFQCVCVLGMLPAVDSLKLRGRGLQEHYLDAGQQAIPLKKDVA